MPALALLMGLALASAEGTPAECRTPPSRTSDSYWSFVESCGCADLEPPAAGSPDQERFLRECSQWRERNPPDGRNPLGAAGARECGNPPSRTSDAFWPYVEACGCGSLDPPSRASLDYDRYLKACGQWRERNPQVQVVTPSARPSPAPSPSPRPSPSPSPSPKGRSGP